jgi:hypothetical protein
MYWVGRRTPPGPRRIPAAALTVILCSFTPLAFHPDTEIVTLCVMGLNAMWLGSCKALGWAAGRGPLTEPLTLTQFIAVATMPITPVLTTAASASSKAGRARQGETGHGALASIADFIAKFVGLAGIVILLQGMTTLPDLVREFLYAFGLYTVLGVVMNPLAAVCLTLINLRVAPHFDRPYLSSSLADFWSRRWNLNTGYTMRFLIYDPVCEGRIVRKEAAEVTLPSTARRALAVCASFVASAALHEVFILYLRRRLSGYWFAFFAVQGPLLLLESMGRRALKSRGVVVPRVLTVPLTLGVLLFLGHTLFYPDILRMGIPQAVLRNVHASVVPRQFNLNGIASQ